MNLKLKKKKISKKIYIALSLSMTIIGIHGGYTDHDKVTSRTRDYVVHKQYITK